MTRPVSEVQFGRFTLDLSQSELFEGNVAISLRPQASLALVLLVERAGRVVSREDLRQALWGQSAVDWDQGTNQVIKQIRRALGDDARAPRFVQTVPRRGYRFVAAVTCSPDPSADPATPPPLPPPLRLRYFGAGMATAVALPVVFLLVCGLLIGP